MLDVEFFFSFLQETTKTVDQTTKPGPIEPATRPEPTEPAERGTYKFFKKQNFE